MAWKAPGWTKAVAVANGTNNFVLSDPSTPGPYRTDVQANADGSLPTGSTVHYVAWRTTTTGDAEAEEGWGTYTLSTRVVTRSAGNVIDGSEGPGVLVDFGLSGQMDVYFLAVLDGSNIPASAAVAFLNNINALGRPGGIRGYGTSDLEAWSALYPQVIQLGDDNALFNGEHSAAGTGIAGNCYFDGAWKYRTTDEATNYNAFNGKHLFRVAASGTIDAAISWISALEILATGEVQVGNLTTGAGAKYDAFPTGTVLLSESIPTGWNAGYVTDGRMIRLAKSGDTLGSQAGTDDPFDGAFATANHVLTITQIPAHTHSVPVVSGTGGSSVGLKSDGDTVLPASATGSAGSGGGHSHTIATPNHRVMVRIVKA